jgi:hypothetical protein
MTRKSIQLVPADQRDLHTFAVQNVDRRVSDQQQQHQQQVPVAIA